MTTSSPLLPADFLDFLAKNADRFERELMDWLRIASVSSDSSAKKNVHAAAEWVKQKFADAGLMTESIATDGFPLIYAETPLPEARDGKKTPVALVYGHYDVQPPEPLELWDSPPFEPVIRDGKIYARGATDDKGQVLTHVLAVTQWLASGRTLPIQIKFLIEGEEEVGSGNLEKYLPRLADKLACDVVAVSDSSQYAPNRPAITCGLRGIATYELFVDGPSHDLHSGSFGGAVMNPAMALCHLLSSMLDKDGKIAIDGFYDDVLPIPDIERDAWKQLGSDDAEFARSVGANALAGEPGFTTDERRWGRPSLDINGLTSGHQGEGVKTVLPAKASAKFSCRLVPGQHPERVTRLIDEHLQRHCPTGVRIELKPDHGAAAMLADATSPYTIAAADAVESAFGVPPVMIREGGSIPILARFQEVLGCDVLLLGWGQNDDAAHSPNEKFSVADFHRGIRASAALWQAIGKP
ncbi:dipeptidase [Allorhodopirellula heiligendammensis]|uniref:Succinyl-diaminopimelate desuccinylase n=1 Tax=Allorhodopirellula heiligendammensis TaxID=2714739 RepID=A0A5C6BWF5_9BACT|nr:dipeptidase [Allorhodopirellula heiligendammensis]TWU16345.1 Succinyl-diaminopimelate desuccinylase [Allorhodopirellula heiligendammensis]